MANDNGVDYRFSKNCMRGSYISTLSARHLNDSLRLVNRLWQRVRFYALGHTYNDMFFPLVPLLLPVLRLEFGLTYGQMGLLATAHVGLRSLMTFVSGYLGDRYSKNRIMSVGFFISAVTLGVLVLARNLVCVTAVLLLMAIGVGTFHTLGTLMATQSAPPQRRGLQLGMFEATGAIGMITISFMFGLLEFIEWRYLCLILSIPGFFVARAYLKPRAKEELDTTVPRPVDPAIIGLVLLARFFATLTLSGFMTFLPTYAVDVWTVSPAIGAVTMGLYQM